MSFSSETKLSLVDIKNEKPCCIRAMLAGMLFFSSQFEENICIFKTELPEVSALFEKLVSEIGGISPHTEKVGVAYRTALIGKDLMAVLNNIQKGERTIHGCFTCKKCDAAFFRGAFLASGFVNPPETQARIELVTKNADLACDAAATLTAHFRLPKLSVRKGSQIIYYRDLESIQYFLSYIGANSASFDMMNAQMLKEKRNEVNRKQNCDMANLKKTVLSAGMYIDAIRDMKASGDFEKLPESLRVTAENRIRNETSTLQELADMENPPLSKSQISKRLKKIYEIYQDTTK